MGRFEPAGARVAVVGTGQLGTALLRPLQAAGCTVLVLDRAALDLAQPATIGPALDRARPALLINAAAHNLVDEAESRPELAFAVNGWGPGLLARAAAARGVRLVQVSTDYVFSGDLGRPYREDDTPGPRSVYGASKLAGEQLVLAAAPDALVLRTCGLFGQAPPAQGRKRSFVEAILQQARGGQALRVVDDRVVSPTFAGDLAGAILALLERQTTGVVHAANEGWCSWWEFARAILAEAGLDTPVLPVASTLWRPGDPDPPRAQRPVFSALDAGRARAWGVALPHWRDALRRYLRQAGEVQG